MEGVKGGGEVEELLWVIKCVTCRESVWEIVGTDLPLQGKEKSEILSKMDGYACKHQRIQDKPCVEDRKKGREATNTKLKNYVLFG